MKTDSKGVKSNREAGKPTNMIEHYTTKNWVQNLGRNSPQFIVIHSTGNTASAKLENANTVNNYHGGVGAHYFVDEKEIYHTLQDDRIIYHCGTAGYYKKKHPLCMNSNSIGIEMCQADGTGKIAPDTIKNTAKLVKYLMNIHKIPKNNVLRHYDVVSKQCPIAYAGTPAREEKWKKLKQQLVD